MVKHGSVDGLANDLLNLSSVRPDVLEEDRVTVGTSSESILFEIKVHRTSQCVSDDEGWACQVVHLHVGANTAFEVTVTRENCSHSEVVVVDGS